MATDNTLNKVMDQGSSHVHIFTVKDDNEDPVDLTGYDVRFQVRSSYGSTNVLINGTLMNGKVAITDALNGIITLTLAPADTSGIRFPEKDDERVVLVYDLEIQSPSGKVYKPARGTFTLKREVTRV